MARKSRQTHSRNETIQQQQKKKGTNTSIVKLLVATAGKQPICKSASRDTDNEVFKLLNFTDKAPRSTAKELDDDEQRPQDSLLEVITTPDRGQAIFTTRKIKAGTLLLAEHPLIALDKAQEDDHDAIEREFAQLSRQFQKVYLKLFDAEKSRMSRVVSIYYSNCYNCEGFKVDGTGGSAVGALASRINHSCIPNAQFSYHEVTNELRFYAIKDIPKGKEVCTNYDKAIFETAVHRRRKQQMYYGFVCDCDACEPKGDFWVRSDERRRAMRACLKVVQSCDKEAKHLSAQGRKETSREAVAALLHLEELLRKEGMMGVPLANVYRSLARWTERSDVKTRISHIRWKRKERDICVTAYGDEGLRTRDIRMKLQELEARCA